MRKAFSLAIVLLGIGLAFPQPQFASCEDCPPPSLSCTIVDDYVETCPGGARSCTVYRCSNGASYTCCTYCEGPN
ncbi:MAG TPA: hypothetical protein VIW92_06650 [Thermoanaerobaculia bacterium]